MKYIFLFMIMVLELFGAVVRSGVIALSGDGTQVSIKVDAIDPGVSGFIVHNIDKDHKTILKNAVVKEFDKETKIAKLSVSDFDSLANSALPNGRWEVKEGDEAVLAFGYTRGLLIAPSEDIYYRITKGSKLQWIHPDIFATQLSFNGHPTPLRSDFDDISTTAYIGLVFVYLQGKVYTLDARSFKILAVTDAKLEQKDTKLPFYTRVPEIDAAWWGEGSDELEKYEPHYFELIAEANPDNKELYDIIKASTDREISSLSEIFDFEGNKNDRKKTFGLF